MSAFFANAQAFNGKGDNKFQVGANFQDHATGIMATYDYGIGENMSIRRFVRIEGAGKVASYIHGGSKIGVLVDVDGGDEALAKDLAVLGERRLTVGRELTKQFEQVVQLSCEGLATWLAADASHARGEFALLLHPPTGSDEGAEAGLPPVTSRALDLLLAELPLKTAVKLCADITGQPRNTLYETALAQRKSRQAEED